MESERICCGIYDIEIEEKRCRYRIQMEGLGVQEDEERQYCGVKLSRVAVRKTGGNTY